MDFSKAIPLTERRNASRLKRGERGLWLRRYCEHRIRDEADFRAHRDYVHINPLKHGLVKRVADWPHSSFHRLVQAGVYPVDSRVVMKKEPVIWQNERSCKVA